MANLRKAGARIPARLAAAFCLVFPLLSLAAETAAPFAEYNGDDRWSTIPAQAAQWKMAANCAWERYVGCELGSVQTTTTGYAYRFVHAVSRPGGGVVLEELDGHGNGAWSCPAGFAVYSEFMGVDVGPYPNRMMDLGTGFPTKCKPIGAKAADEVAAEAGSVPDVTEDFEQGRLVERHVGGGDPATWSVAWDAAGAEVSGRGDREGIQARIEQGRAVSLGKGLRLDYDADGALDTVRGDGGTVFSRAWVNDPEGRLVAALRDARHRLPSGPASAPVDTLVRLGESIDALLDGRRDPHARQR
jgi:hypothetical protein